tara:strand:- start:7 stop:1104 length:1098 start_codon:yes stop_codon:yes gene_type:complete
MLSPDAILTWLERNVNGVRVSRLKTLSAIVPAAMAMRGVTTHDLGRFMPSDTDAKHSIKRVDRFLGNARLEVAALAQGIFDAFAPRRGRVLVLADWTDVTNGKMLVFSMPCNGRSIPFYTKVVPKNAGKGVLKKAEMDGLRELERICDSRSEVIIVADRGFGNKRWLAEVRALGFHFVQRLSNVFHVDTERYIGALGEMDLRKKAKARNWGRGTIGEDQVIEGMLITTYDPRAKEPWYLVTDLDDLAAEDVVQIYRQRWWIETTFRDGKNRAWGLGLDHVDLKNYERYERLFYIVALAFIFLSAHGAAAEMNGFADTLKANTRKTRVLNLIRTGSLYIIRHGLNLREATRALQKLATFNTAPNWG